MVNVVDATMFWSPSGGGVRRYLLTKHAWFARQPGFRHRIAVPRIDGPPQVDTVDLPSWPLPGSGGYRLPVSRSGVAGVLAGLRPDVVEAGDPYRVAWGALDAARATGAAAVAYCHSDLEAMARLVAGRAGAALARRYAGGLYRRFDLVLAPSASMQRRLTGWGVEGAVVQPLGVDTQAFRPDRASSRWKASLGLADDARVLVYAGRFAAEKHLPVLADAVRRLGAPYVLVAIGAGPLPPPAGDRVRVVPFVRSVDALAEALASADAFVHAGDQETFGLSALEAMAAGTPVVVRRVAGMAELVDAAAAAGLGAGAVGVDRGDGAACAEAVTALFEGDVAAARAAARRHAERCDWNAVLPRLASHYRRLRGHELGTDAVPDDVFDASLRAPCPTP